MAIWTPGGVGGGHFDQGFPRIMKIIQELSGEYHISVYSVASTGSFQFPGISIVSPRNQTRLPAFRWLYLVWSFYRSHRRNRFNVLYGLWGYPTGLVAVVLGKVFAIPSVINVLGGDAAYVPSLSYGHLVKPVSRRLVIWACNHATKLIVLSVNQVATLKKYGLKREPQLIHWGADPNQFRWIQKEPDGHLKILHVANLTEVKDQVTLIKAFSHIVKARKARLRIVGPDYLNGALTKLVKELSMEEHVEFTGPVPFTDIASHYQWADVFVLTSLSEGQNNAVTEAALCGLLVVSTPVGPAVDIGSDGVIIVPFGEPMTLAEKLLTVVDSRVERSRMIETATAWALRYDFQWTMRELKVLFQSVT
jgi:glycosyltransferase involved in cell wall biosynthesis